MKKNRSPHHTAYILAACMLIFSAVMLTGCAGQMENLFTRPQKVTIEHNATVEPTPTPEPTETPTPTPTPVPIPTEAPETGSSVETSSAGSTAADGTDTTAGGTNTTAGQNGKEEPEKAELPEGTLEPVGVTKEEAEAAAEAMHEKVIEAANDRLDHGYYSKETLIAGLVEDGFTWEEATYGAEHCYIEWGY